MNTFSEPGSACQLPPGRWIGVDLGQKRVGLALSDPTGTIATALATVEYRGPVHLIGELRKYVKQTGAVGLVIGLPRRTDGSEGPEALEARQAAGMIRRDLALPVALWDERMTTRIAAQTLRESGMNSRNSRQVVDRVAAQILLQSYLDAHAAADHREV